MAIGPKSQRDQILTAIAILAFALVGAYWYFVYDPKTADVTKTAMHVDSLDASNQSAKATLAKGTTEQIRAEAASYRENLELMRTLVPAGNEVPALVEQVSTSARRAGLDLSAVEPQPVVEGEQFDTYHYKIAVTGGFHALGEFLTNVGSLTRIVAPVNLSLTPAANAAMSAVKLRPEGTAAIDSKFEIQTYVIKTAPSARGGKS